MQRSWCMPWCPRKMSQRINEQGIPKHKTVGWGCLKVWFCSRYVGKLLLKLEETVFAWFCVELCVYHSSRTRWWFEKQCYSPRFLEGLQNVYRFYRVFKYVVSGNTISMLGLTICLARHVGTQF